MAALYEREAKSQLETGLVAYYPFNGNAIDETGNGNDGTVNGAKLTQDRRGFADKAYVFNGTSDYIDASDKGFPSEQKKKFIILG